MVMTTAPAPALAPALAGQAVVVIGGSAGMGLETARLARAEGAEVILAARDPERRPRSARPAPRPSTSPTRPPSTGSSPACRPRSTT